MLPRLAERLPEFELVTDPDPEGQRSPLRTYLECLKRTPADAAVRVVVQDDCWPCVDFGTHAEAALAERPNKIVAFFVPGIRAAGAKRVSRVREKGGRWVNIGGTAITPVVATAWPADLIGPLVDFAESPRIQARYTHDDPVATLFVKKHKLDVWATIPSLVQHPDIEPSLIDKPHGGGKFRGRVAAFFIDNP